MKKYQNMTKAELLEVIAEKNKTIARINGEMYYLKKWYEYNKQKNKNFTKNLMRRKSNGK